MMQSRRWGYVMGALGALALGSAGVGAAVVASQPAHAAPVAPVQWGTVRSVTYHATSSSDVHGLIAIVELFDGRRFVHTLDGSSRRVPAPGEVWNIDSDTPPPGWKPRK